MWRRRTTAGPREIAHRILEDAWRRKKACRWVRVEGGSMGQTIPSGSWIQIQFAEDWFPHRGELLYFRRPGGTRVVHRCLFRCGAFILERGDANWVPGWCVVRQVLGAVREIASSAPGADSGGRE